MLEKKIRYLTFISIILIVISIVFINYMGRKLNDNIIHVATVEATKIAKYVVNHVINEELAKGMESLIETVKNKDGDIIMINFDTTKVNTLLNNVTNRILTLFKELEEGNSDMLDLSRNLLTNLEIKDYKEGIILEVPAGLSLNNFIFSNLGPKIPVRLALTGELESYVTNSIEEYGINNSLLTTFINIAVSQEVLMPLGGKKITIVNKIPISINMINGKVPPYYLGGRLGSSSNYNLNVEN